MYLVFSQPGGKEINRHKSGGRAGFDTILCTPIHIPQFYFNYTEYFAPNFEEAPPALIHIIVLLNKALVNFYKKSHTTRPLRPRQYIFQVGGLLVFKVFMFFENLYLSLRFGPVCGYCCVRE
jgi:hypothetical protein